MEKLILSEEQINKIIELYKSGLSYAKIQGETGIDANKVKRTLMEYNVPLRPHKIGCEIRRGFTEYEKEQIIKLYTSGIGLTTICKRFSCSPIPTKNMLKDMGVKIRNTEEAHEYQKMAIDESFFDNIDNQDKAYILGFWFADGTNHIGNKKPEYSVSLVQRVEDIDILKRMRYKLGMERKLIYYTRPSDGRKYVRLEFKNKHISLRLSELGVVPRKTFITKFPDYLSDELVPHFLRGLMDGDGCIAKNLKTVSFAGSHEMMCGVVQQFEKYLGFTAHVVDIKHSPGISSVAIGRLEYKAKLIEWLYKDADLKLERKFNLAMQIIDKYNEKLAG